MFRPAALLTVAAASLAAGPGSAQVSVSGGDCEVVRILADGREVRSVATNDGSASTHVEVGGGKAGAASAQSRSGSSRSSVSVSSSTSAGGGSARAVASHIDAEGRKVTTTHDENGCRIVIDERGR